MRYKKAMNRGTLAFRFFNAVRFRTAFSVFVQQGIGPAMLHSSIDC